MIPTRRALILLGVASLAGFLGYLSDAGLDALLAADAAVIALAVIDYLLAAPPIRISWETRTPPAFSVGRSAAVVRTWRNDCSRRARLRVREHLPPQLGKAVDIVNLEVEPGGEQRQEFLVEPTARGVAEQGWVSVRSTGPLGLAIRQRTTSTDWSHTVYPGLPTAGRMALSDRSRARRAGRHAFRRVGSGRIFESLREWVPGDDIRHIDWKSSARHRTLMTRQYEDERRQRVMILLDAGRLATADIRGRSRFEYAVDAALSIALAAWRQDDDVGVMVFADEIMHYVPPQRGRRGLQLVLETLATALPKMTEPDYPRAFSYLAVRNRKRSLAVLFTDVIDATASSALVAQTGSVARRHLPLAVTLRNPELETIAGGTARETREAYRRAAAEELLRARAEALGEMRRSGAIVLNVDPANAGEEVVRSYLEIKRIGRL